MVIVTGVQFTHENGVLVPTLERLPDANATVVRETSTDPGQSIYVVRFDADEPGEIRPALEADPTVHDVESMPGFEDRTLWAVEFTDDAALLNPKVTTEDGVVLDARSSTPDDGPRGWHEHWLLPDREALHEIWQHAREEGFEFEVLEFRDRGRTDLKYPGPTAPTDEQRETLVAAFEQGYFAEPRETSLEELAASLDLSPTAVGGRLRRGMKALVGMTLVVDNPDQ